MSELTDDQLDGLFRKSAEEYQPPFDPAAWDDMRSRLDTNDYVAPTGSGSLVKTIVRWGLPAALLLLIGLGGWWVYRPAIQPRSAAVPTVLSMRVTPAPAEEVIRTNPPANRPTAYGKEAEKSVSGSVPANTVSGPALRADVTASDRQTSGKQTGEVVARLAGAQTVTDEERTVSATSANTHEKRKPAEPVSAYAVKGKRVNQSPLAALPAVSTSAAVAGRPRLAGGARPVGDPFGRARRDKAVVSELPAVGDRNGVKAGTEAEEVHRMTNRQTPQTIPATEGVAGEEESATAANTGPAAVTLPSLKELTVRPARWPQFSRGISRPVAAQPDTVARKIVPQPVAVRGLSVRFEVAPDLSTVGLKNFSRPGTNVGLLLEYRLAPRWSVQAGLIQSTKVYSALTSEYTAPPELWKSPMKAPISVDGRCNMFDIPINVRYDVLIKPRPDGRLPTRWFVSGGLTSYIMKSEEYYYTYPPHTYNQLGEYEVRSGSYGFSNLNLSVGYERSISRRLSWQVEPFMKVPLKGVGFFKVNLLSTGTFFSLRYKL